MSESKEIVRKIKIGKELLEAILDTSGKHGILKDTLLISDKLYFDIFDIVETIMIDNEFGNCRSCDRIDPETAAERSYNEGYD
jgi:hypothetical protein